MKILALDLSMKNSGYALYIDSKLDTYGVIPEPKYKGKSTERYPQRTAKVGIMMSKSLIELIITHEPDSIVIEELSIGGRAGIKSIKGLAMMHGVLLGYIHQVCMLDRVSMVTPSGKGGWRTILQMKKNGCFKKSAVKMANTLLKLNLTDDQHDIADAILLGLSQLPFDIRGEYGYY